MTETPTPRTQQHWAEAVAECVTDEQEALRLIGMYEDDEWQSAMLDIGRALLAAQRALTAEREARERAEAERDDLRTGSLTFAAFRRANVTRCSKWHPAGIESWSPSDWMTAVTGELGELASLLKMRNRERDGLPGNKFSPTQKQIADELADVLTYLDLLAHVLGVDLGRAAAEKFNEVSARVGFPDRIELEGCAAEEHRVNAAKPTAPSDPSAAMMYWHERAMKAEAEAERLRGIIHDSYMALPIPPDQMAFADDLLTPHVRAVADEWTIRERQLAAEKAEAERLREALRDVMMDCDHMLLADPAAPRDWRNGVRKCQDKARAAIDAARKETDRG